MTLKQIFGYTELKQAPAGQYVKYMTAMQSEDKDEISFSIRGSDGIFKYMNVPGDAAMTLAFKIILACRNRDRHQMGLPPLTTLTPP